MGRESEIIEAARAGSAAAFTALVERYQDRLYRFLVTRCHSTQDAEDALQETFVNAWRYLGSYDPRWRFSTWLYRIALRNAAGGTRPPHVELSREPADPSSDPLRECIRDSSRRNLWLLARARLTPDAFTAVWLHYGEDMLVRDVARVMERGVPWVKVNLSRARRRLARELEGETAS